MGDKVIYPVQFTRGRRDRASDLERAGSDLAANRLARLQKILSDKSKKGPVFGKSDRIAAALAVGRLVHRARQTGVTVEKIKGRLEEKAKPGKKPGTSRLDRYMLSPRLDAQQLQVRSKKLMQRVRGYLEAVEAVADLTGINADEAKCEVLCGTRLWSQASQQRSEQDERAAWLALGLSEMGQCVIRESKLPEILDRARRIPGKWDVIEHQFKPSTMACMFQCGYLDSFEHWTEAPPLPGVPLVRHLHSMLVAPVLVATEGTIAPTTQSDGFEGTEKTGNFMLFREVRLVLGPTTDTASLGVMFETRARVRLALDKEVHRLQPDISLKPVDDPYGNLPAAAFQAKIGERWHHVRTLEALDQAECFVIRKGDHVGWWSPDPLRNEHPVEHWYFSWTACNEETVRYWLDHPLKTMGAVEACPPIAGLRSQHGTRWYAKPSAALEVESALVSGALEKALFEQIDLLTEQLAIRERAWREDATATMSALVEGWRKRIDDKREGD